MANRTIIAVYDTHAHADLAIADLAASGVSESAIQHYAQETVSGITISDTSLVHPQGAAGNWAFLAGDGLNSDRHTLFTRSIDSGHTVVTVAVGEHDAVRISAILEEHDPSTSKGTSAFDGVAARNKGKAFFSEEKNQKTFGFLGVIAD